MQDGNNGPIKSAYDLVLERLDKENDNTPTLTEGQKEEIALVEKERKAKLAEMDILFKQRKAQAIAENDSKRLEELEIERIKEIKSIEDETETQKEEIRRKHR